MLRDVTTRSQKQNELEQAAFGECVGGDTSFYYKVVVFVTRPCSTEFLDYFG